VAAGTELDLPLLATVRLPTAEELLELAPMLKERLPLHALSAASAVIDNKNLT
jgi:hypothetical protein